MNNTHVTCRLRSLEGGLPSVTGSSHQYFPPASETATTITVPLMQRPRGSEGARN